MLYCAVLSAQLCPTLCYSMDCTHQAPLLMGFCRQEHWSGLPFPSLGDLVDPRIKPTSPALASRFFTNEPLDKHMHLPKKSCNRFT